MANQKGKKSSKSEKHCLALGLGKEWKVVSAKTYAVKMQQGQEFES